MDFRIANRTALVLCIIAWLSALPASAQLVTTNIVVRLFEIKQGTSTGSSFALDVDGRQYLITARHVLPRLSARDTISILKDGSWHDLPVSTIEPIGRTVDIVALAPETQLAPSLPLDFGIAGIIFGQDMYFLGFPYGKSNAPSVFDKGFPVPAVKKCILAAIDNSFKDSVVLLLDGVNNPGFSGGPAIFYNNVTKRHQVAGVVSGYLAERIPVYSLDSSVSPPQKMETGTFVEANTGIILASAIEPIIAAIRSNPIGPPVR
jgi:hypothetical protein